LCENRQRQSCKAFIGLSIRAKMIGGASYAKIWPKLTHPSKTPIFNRFSLIVSRPWHFAKKVELTRTGRSLCAFQCP